MYNSRMFPRGCKDEDMPEYQFFYLTNSSGTKQTDKWGSWYHYSSSTGQGNLYFEDLPKGEYNL